MKRRILTSLSLAILTLTAGALELPEQIGGNMMLQQQTKVRIWGWAKSGSTVSVAPSWDNKNYTTKTSKKDGRWELLVETPAASFDVHSIRFEGDSETRTLANVLVREVYLGNKMQQADH